MEGMTFDHTAERDSDSYEVCEILALAADLGPEHPEFAGLIRAVEVLRADRDQAEMTHMLYGVGLQQKFKWATPELVAKAKALSREAWKNVDYDPDRAVQEFGRLARRDMDELRALVPVSEL